MAQTADRLFDFHQSTPNAEIRAFPRCFFNPDRQAVTKFPPSLQYYMYGRDPLNAEFRKWRLVTLRP
jgi:hypothetical protein